MAVRRAGARSAFAHGPLSTHEAGCVDCAMATDALAGRKPRGRRKWSNAVRTACPCGRTHASRMEKGVCDRLRAELPPGGYILHQVRWPLPNLGPNESGGAHAICVDFTVIAPGTAPRFVDAKCKGRVSRDWRRGAAAFRGHYGTSIEEVAR